MIVDPVSNIPAVPVTGQTDHHNWTRSTANTDNSNLQDTTVFHEEAGVLMAYHMSKEAAAGN